MSWYDNESLIKFTSPCTITLISASSGGKTTFVKQMLAHSAGMFQLDFSKVIYCYGSTWQPIFDEMLNDKPDMTFREGLPSVEELETFTTGEKHTCLILDDLMMEINSSPKIEKLWTVHSHHFNMTIIYLAHNLYQKSPSARTISLNTQYYILFKNHRDTLQILHFARQIYPNKTQYFMQAYQLATKEAYGYIVVDLTSLAVEDYRLRTHIFPGEDTFIYVPTR